MEAVVDHELVSVDEFDALAIDIKTPLSRKYPAKTHARKVAKELGVDHGIMYLPGKLEETWEDSDMGPPFRQRRFFYYITGADFSGCAVTYDIGADRLVLWIPYTPPSMVLWFGTTPSPEDCLAKSQLDEVRYISDLRQYLVPRLSRVGVIYVLRESQVPDFRGSAALKPRVKVDTTSLLPAISEARVVKSDYEIAQIRKACDVSSAAHKAVCQRLLKLSNECEIEAIFAAACTAENAHKQSYAIIAGSGPNAGTLHYDANDQPLKGRQLVVLDSGAEWECYASDITRTLPIGGKFTKEGKAVYEVVAQMQEECIAAIKPGTMFYNLHLHAHRVATAGLVKLGILHNGTADEIYNNGTTSAFFPHGLGHHVGLDVHDVGGREKLMLKVLQSLQSPVRTRDGYALHPWDDMVRGGKRVWVSDVALQAMINDATARATTTGGPYTGRRKLEKNMVVTIEPGIYFCKEYMEAYYLKNPKHAKYINTKALERYWDVGGVRIEDCVLVTGDGYEVISSAPKGEEMLRVINGK